MRAVGEEILATQAKGSRSVENDSEGPLRVFGDTDQIRVGEFLGFCVPHPDPFVRPRRKIDRVRKWRHRGALNLAAIRK